MRCARSLLLSLALVGCRAAEDGAPMPPPALVDGAASDAPVPNAADPSALAEIVAQARSETPSASGAGKTLIGSDTGLPEEAAPPPSGRLEPTESARIQEGVAEFQPALSSPAIEHAARAQLYWRLRDCRRGDGTAPPPESITLGFTIRPDGSVDPASVSASAEDESLAEVALCALRTFSALPFVGPAAGLETSSRVLITWPSVD